MGAENNALNADYIADVPLFEVGVGVLADHILAHIKLDASLLILKIRKGGFSHSALAHNAPGDGNNGCAFLALRRVNKACLYVAGICGNIVFGYFKRILARLTQCVKLIPSYLQKLGKLLCRKLLFLNVFVHYKLPFKRE